MTKIFPIVNMNSVPFASLIPFVSGAQESDSGENDSDFSELFFINQAEAEKAKGIFLSEGIKCGNLVPATNSSAYMLIARVPLKEALSELAKHHMVPGQVVLGLEKVEREAKQTIEKRAEQTGQEMTPAGP